MKKYIPQFCKELILIHVLIPMLVRSLLVKEDPLDTYLCQASNHYLHWCRPWYEITSIVLCAMQWNYLLSIIDALTSTLVSRHAWVITSHCFNKKVILIHVLSPVLVWQISLCEWNPSWCIWARHRTITCINDGLFSIGPLGAYHNDI